MKVQDGSIKVLIMNYQSMAQPSEIPMGILFQNTVLSLSETGFLVNNLNKSAGWHYRNGEYIIQGNKYIIAQIYEEDRPISEIYPKQYVDFNDANTVQKLLNSSVPRENLGVPAELFNYVKEQPVQQATQEYVQQNTENGSENFNELGDLQKYLTPEERATLNMLDEEEFESLLSTLEERKGQAMISEMVTYELPQELSNYNLIYREYIINKSVNASEGSDLDVNQLKHEIGLKEVLNHMILTPNVINQEGSSGGSDDDFVTANFSYLSNYLSQVFRNLGEVPIDTNIQLSFTTTRQDIIAKIKTAYGNYSNFVDKYVQMKVGDQILPTESLVFEDLSLEFKIVKSYDNIRGFGINFVMYNEELQSDYIFAYPLLRAIAEYSSAIRVGNFKSVYNALLEPYLAEIGLTGLNIEKMKIQNHEVTQLPCEYMGVAETEGQILYLFRDLNEDKYFILYKTAMGNRLLGTKYVLVGHNFEINYRADNIYIRPISKPRLSTNAEVLNFFEGLPNDKLGEVYKPYYALADTPTVKSIENLEIRKIAENYEQLLEATAKLGYKWNINLTDADIQLVYTENQPTQQQSVDIFAQQPQGVVDIFAQQPAQTVDIFAQQPKQEPAPQMGGWDEAMPKVAESISQEPTHDENGLLLRPSFSVKEDIRNTIERCLFLMENKVNGKDIVTSYLMSHRSILHNMGLDLGLNMTYTSDPHSGDNQLHRHEILTSVVDRIVQTLEGKLQKNETTEEGDFTIMEGTKITDSLKKIQNVYAHSNEQDQKKLSEMLEFVTEFINRFK